MFVDEIEFTNQLVLFIDVLGTKKKCNMDLLRDFHKIFAMLQEDVNFDNSFFHTDNLKIKIFSDNIAIARDCTGYDKHEKRNALCNMILFAIYIQNDFLNRGFLTRGGIAYGECYIDEIMIMGQALIDAYLLESKLAIYPRILISTSLIRDLNFNYKYLSMDDDEKYFVNYILWETIEAKQLLEKRYNFINKNIKDISMQEKDKAKYKWLKNKLDVECNKMD